jgi:Reverse transcriptase (RNA-dependent DNA polymerase)
MNAKLLMQKAKRQSNPLYMVFLDIKKAYNTLDRTRTLSLLEQYGVGPNTRRIIKTIWDGDNMTSKQNNYFGNHFKVKRGVGKGDKISPTIFNSVIDAVFRATETEMRKNEKTTIIFYADDGFVGGYNYEAFQQTIDAFVQKFKAFGLMMNADKTETTTLLGSKSAHQISNKAYH